MAEYKQELPPVVDAPMEWLGGGCHCGDVRFQVLTAREITAFDCNCSICRKKQNIHFIVPASRFRLLQGADKLTSYSFNTGVAKHKFCSRCGVQSFYTPRSNPDGFGVNPYCLDEADTDVTHATTPLVIHRMVYNGKDWEKSYEQSGVAQLSK